MVEGGDRSSRGGTCDTWEGHVRLSRNRALKVGCSQLFERFSRIQLNGTEQTFIPREEKAHPASVPAAPAAVLTRFAWPDAFCPGEPSDANSWFGSSAVSGCRMSQYYDCPSWRYTMVTYHRSGVFFQPLHEESDCFESLIADQPKRQNRSVKTDRFNHVQCYQLLWVNQCKRHTGNNLGSEFVDLKTVNGGHKTHQSRNPSVNKGVFQCL